MRQRDNKWKEKENDYKESNDKVNFTTCNSSCGVLHAMPSTLKNYVCLAEFCMRSRYKTDNMNLVKTTEDKWAGRNSFFGVGE